MKLNKRQKTALIIGLIIGIIIVVIVYSVYQQILQDEDARLRQVKQEDILYDKHKQQCHDIASDLSVRIQELIQRDASRSDLAEFGNRMQSQRNALVAEASQLLDQCPHWIIEEVDRQIKLFTSPQ
jgi:hypothetical protein